MIKVEGPIDVTIVEAYTANPKFPYDPEKDNPTNNAGEQITVWGDVVLLCETADGQRDYWHGEISNRDGIGNFADKTRTDLTIKTLQDIGFAVPNWNALWEQIVDDGSIPNLVGIKCTAVVDSREYKDKTYYQIKYLNAPGSSIKRMSKSEMQASFSQGGFSKQPQQATQAPAQQTPTSPPPAANNMPAAPAAPAVQTPAPGTAPANPYAGQR